MDSHLFKVTDQPKSYREEHIKRLSWRNERNLYKRNCDLTGQPMISMYHPDSPFPVYSQEAWYSSGWDPLQYGQNLPAGRQGYDFNRPFFDQFYELQCKVPRLSNIIVNTENCDYCNIIGDCKNCYLIFGSINCEDCLYGNPYDCKNCIDSLVLRNSELCYECIDSNNLYECFFCQNCYNSRNLMNCYDLQGCEECFLCAGLRQKKYCILNKQCAKDEYLREKYRILALGSEHLKQKLEELKKKIPHKYMEGVNNENVTGDHTAHSKNCQALFNGENCEEVNYSTQMLKSNNCLECDYGEMGNFIFNTSGFYKSTNVLFSHWVWEVANLYYCSICALNTRDCFGCISLRHKQYCILNKQYTKEEYEDLVPRIIAHIKSTGEWDKFFPIKFSPFAYNESIAQEYFPLTKQEILNENYRWMEPKDTIQETADLILAEDLPSIFNADESIVKTPIKCAISGRLFRIMPVEFKFYKKYQLPLPALHPDERHKNRLNKRNPRVLNDRNCDKCGTAIKTTYDKSRPEIVYCEACYLKEIY